MRQNTACVIADARNNNCASSPTYSLNSGAWGGGVGGFRSWGVEGELRGGGVWGEGGVGGEELWVGVECEECQCRETTHAGTGREYTSPNLLPGK